MHTSLDNHIAGILLNLQSHWERLAKTQRTQWNAYADYRLLSQPGICTLTSPLMGGNEGGLTSPLMGGPRGAFILQNFYRLFYGPLNDMGQNNILFTPVFAPPEHMDIWGPKGEWSNKDIIRYPFPLDIKKHIAIIWESAPFQEESEKGFSSPYGGDQVGGNSPLPLGGAGGGCGLSLMSFTTLNGRDQDTTLPYREQFSRIPKAGQYIIAKVGFANKLTGVVSNLVTIKQKVVSSK